MERGPDGAALGALGLAGICRETFVFIRARRPGFASMAGELVGLSLSRLAHVAISRAFLSRAVAASDAGAGSVRLAANWGSFFLVEAACLLCVVLPSLSFAAYLVHSAAPRYGFVDDRDARSIAHELRTVPRFLASGHASTFQGNSRRAARALKVGWRLVVTTFDAFLLLLGYTALFGAAAWLAHHHLLAAAAPGEEIGVQLPRTAVLLAGAAYLAGAAHIGAVWRVACVMLVLEDDWGFRGMHVSDELLAGKFWAAAPVLWTLDGCIVAVQLAFGALVVDNSIGLGVCLRVAAGMVMAAALWLAVMAGQVAQVVVYFVCKSNHRGSSEGTTANNLEDVGRRGRATRKRQ
ncbi:unnamed protein product [Triticum turgidum subsp. durum]|uniref:Uncharacterized protein n=1 Tax=Triticum turgidum subsp. durum TaxID=4567 RepID=A0A9R1AA56_TRITD|nr:unnamed protein product [Triticum turgidum subsp. durum]